MSTFLVLTTIVKYFSISLGVGSSTLAILNFFAAVKDGHIDETERRMMGIVYIVLRVAMVLILFTSLVLVAHEHEQPSLLQLSPYVSAQLITLLVLFTNALFMTIRMMPSTFGPAIQAGSWYTLGVLSTLSIVDLTEFTLPFFLLCYVAWIILVIGIINGILSYLEAERKKFK